MGGTRLAIAAIALTLALCATPPSLADSYGKPYKALYISSYIFFGGRVRGAPSATRRATCHRLTDGAGLRLTPPLSCALRP